VDTRPLAACRCYRKIYDNLDSENGRSPSIFFLIFCCHRFLSQRGNVTPEFVFFIQKITAYAVLFLQTLERVETSAGGTRYIPSPSNDIYLESNADVFFKKKLNQNGVKQSGGGAHPLPPCGPRSFRPKFVEARSCRSQMYEQYRCRFRYTTCQTVLVALTRIARATVLLRGHGEMSPGNHTQGIHTV
jgi:hypothetical protein